MKYLLFLVLLLVLEDAAGAPPPTAAEPQLQVQLRQEWEEKQEEKTTELQRHKEELGSVWEGDVEGQLQTNLGEGSSV